MAISNLERVGKALEHLRDGLQPFVERELTAALGSTWKSAVSEVVADTQLGKGKSNTTNDVAVLLVVMDRKWGQVFRSTLGKAERSLANELLEVRKQWAHQEPFSSDDCYRALDSCSRLLTSISAPQADEVEKLKMELQRIRFDEQLRTEKRKAAGTAIESAATGGLTPWREVVSPHRDVASGRYQQAEFAADLWQVHIGEGTDEYKKPAEFFRRTYLTESRAQPLGHARLDLRRQVVGERVAQQAVDVVELPLVVGRTHRPFSVAGRNGASHCRSFSLARSTWTRAVGSLQPGAAHEPQDSLLVGQAHQVHLFGSAAKDD